MSEKNRPKESTIPTRELRTPEEKADRIRERIGQTMRAVQLLIDHGDGTVAAQSRIEPGLISREVVDEKFGVILYDGTDPDIVVPVLEQVYGQLGAVRARIDAIPDTSTLGDQTTCSYTFPILDSIKLTEEQVIFPDNTKYYRLYGHKT
jgi:hypothetical protein